MSKIFVEIYKDTNTKAFFLFVILCCVLGTLVQWIGLPSIDHDELEAVRWGATKNWFVDKHPPLVGFVSYWWASLTGFSNLGFFILSKLIAILSLIIIYCLNRHFLSPYLALIATAAYGSTYAYITLMSQVDANAIIHPIWPLLCLVLWNSLNSDKLIYWIFLGALSALSILGKYQSALLLITAFFLILSSRNYRKSLINFKFYISLFIFLIILTPHFHSYVTSDYSIKNYITSRGIDGNKAFSGRLSVLPFLSTQILTWLFGYLILFFSLRKNFNYKILKKNMSIDKNKTYFLFFMGLLLPISPILVSLISGISLLGSWGLVSWFLLPTLLLNLFNSDINKHQLRPYLFFVPAYILIMLFVVILNNYKEIARPTPIPSAVKLIDQFWGSKIIHAPHTVITNSRPAQGMSFYSRYKPQVIYGEPKLFSWLLDLDKCTKGPTMIITYDTIAGIQYMEKQFKIIGKPDFVTLIDVSSSKFRFTTTSQLNFKLAGYSQPVCFD